MIARKNLKSQGKMFSAT